METILENYQPQTVELTANECAFMMSYLSSNGCGARTPDDLLSDNYSCQAFEDLVDMFPELSEPQIKGTLGSLINKQILWIEDDRGYEYPFDIKGRNNPKLPDLYWVSEWYLEELNPELKFW